MSLYVKRYQVYFVKPIVDEYKIITLTVLKVPGLDVWSAAGGGAFQTNNNGSNRYHKRRVAQDHRSRLHGYFIERLTMLADMLVPPIGCILVNSSPSIESQRSSRPRGLLRSVCRTNSIILNIEDATRVSNQFHSFDRPATAEACGVGGVQICAAPFHQTTRGPASCLPATPVAH